MSDRTVWAVERRSAAAPPTIGPAFRPAAAISLRRLLPASSSPGGCPSLPAASSRSSPALNRSVAFCRRHEIISISHCVNPAGCWLHKVVHCRLLLKH